MDEISSTLNLAEEKSIFNCDVDLKDMFRGAWVAQWVKPLPSAQVMISGSWDRVPHRALCSAGSLLPSLSLSVCLSAYL